MGKSTVSPEINRAICDALGLDASKTLRISLEFGPGRLPQVFVEQIVDGDRKDLLAPILKRYKLIPLEEEKPNDVD